MGRFARCWWGSEFKSYFSSFRCKLLLEPKVKALIHAGNTVQGRLLRGTEDLQGCQKVQSSNPATEILDVS